MKTSAAGVGLLRSSVKQTYPLVLAFLLISQGFVFSSGSVALAQKRSLSVAGGQQRPAKRILTAETPQISNGALIDLEIQRNPKAYADTGESAPVPKRVAPTTITGEGPNPLAPALGTTFEAINFNQDATATGFFHIPPDPAGAVGPTHVVNVVNTSIEWYTKAGVRQNRQRLGLHPSLGLTGAFFASQSPVTGTFDPKVIYDQYSNRFVVVTMERVEDPDGVGPAVNQSRVFLAVSDDSDPNGTWHFQTLITEETIAGAQSWADFPGLALDSEAVYFTTNMFAHNNQPGAGTFTGQRTWILAKAPWYTGGTPVATRFNTAAVTGGEGALATTMQPTQMYGDTPGGVGTFLLAYSGLSDAANNLLIQIVQIDNPLTAPTFTGHFSPWGTIGVEDSLIAFPGAPQLGTTRTIATNDRRFSQNGVHRGNFIYCAVPIRRPASAPTDAGEVTVHWFKIDSTTLLPLLVDTPPVDQGNIGGEDIATGTYTFFPSVAVDSVGNMAVGFAASGPNIFPGAYYTGRLAADPPGTMQPAGGLRAGRDFYVRTFNSPTAPSRWGDYSGMWLDPSDETTFWVFNEYALPRGTTGLGSQPAEDGRWGNAWGSFSLASPAGATPLGAVLISEFRYNGPNGASDEFIEIYNNTDATITVNDVNPPATGPSGWAIVSGDNLTAAKAIIPSGATIPARGHYLVANSVGYSLGQYPSGNNGLVATNATPDLTYTTDIPINRGIALFRTANPASFTLGTDRLDAVGPASEIQPATAPYREGTGLPDIAAIASDYSWARRLPGGCTGTQPGFVNHNCTSAALVASTPISTSGNVQDTDNNVTDFIFVDINGTATPVGNQRLGAPGPENLTSPIVRAAPTGVGTINPSRIDPMQGTAAPPNRVRDLTPVTNGPFGTIDIRRKFTNNTGQSLTRLRFRIMDITTFPALDDTGTANDAADLRALSSGNVVVTLTDTSMITVNGTTLEVDSVGNPGQPVGGAFNSSLSAGTVTLGTPLASGATIDLRFVFGVAQPGKFRVFVTVEALP